MTWAENDDPRAWVLAHGIAQRCGVIRGQHLMVNCCGIDWTAESLERHLKMNNVRSEEDWERHRVEYVLREQGRS